MYDPTDGKGWILNELVITNILDENVIIMLTATFFMGNFVK